MPPPLDLAGRRFDRLTVREAVKAGRRYKWRCDCDCGGSAVAFGYNLLSGNTTSCGCKRREGTPKVGYVPSIEKACLVCGVAFLGVAKQVYCSPKCCSRARYPGRKIACPVCGKAVHARVSGKTYCDDRCKRVADNRRQLAGKAGSADQQAATLAAVLAQRMGEGSP